MTCSCTVKWGVATSLNLGWTKVLVRFLKLKYCFVTYATGKISMDEKKTLERQQRVVKGLLYTLHSMVPWFLASVADTVEVGFTNGYYRVLASMKRLTSAREIGMSDVMKKSMTCFQEVLARMRWGWPRLRLACPVLVQEKSMIPSCHCLYTLCST